MKRPGTCLGRATVLTLHEGKSSAGLFDAVTDDELQEELRLRFIILTSEICLLVTFSVITKR